jgi:phosphatidylglycerophosphate synthase
MIRTGPVTGFVVQLGLLATLAATIGLSGVGWAAGVGYGVAVAAALTRSMNRADLDGFGPADRVTMTRATLVGCVTALVLSTPVHVWVLVWIATLALVLDAVDGWVARHTGTVSPLGARFDMEVDAFLILVLSIYVARILGPWVLAIGLMRYLYVVAGWIMPWLRGRVPPRYWRKVVAAIQGIVLAAASSSLFPTFVSAVALAGALVLLLESFGRDVLWQYRYRAPAAPLPVDHELEVAVDGVSTP